MHPLDCLDDNKWKPREKPLTKNDLLLLLYLLETRSEFSSLINKLEEIFKSEIEINCVKIPQKIELLLLFKLLILSFTFFSKSFSFRSKEC